MGQGEGVQLSLGRLGGVADYGWVLGREGGELGEEGGGDQCGVGLEGWVGLGRVEGEESLSKG